MLIIKELGNIFWSQEQLVSYLEEWSCIRDIHITRKLQVVRISFFRVVWWKYGYGTYGIEHRKYSSPVIRAYEIDAGAFREIIFAFYACFAYSQFHSTQTVALSFLLEHSSIGFSPLLFWRLSNQRELNNSVVASCGIFSSITRLILK